MAVNPPAPRPCASCPYRRDVPSGIWDAEEYAKLPLYDAPAGEQPSALFLCHQADRDSPSARVCAGWVGCHDAGQLLALRLACVMSDETPEFVAACWDYVSPVPLFNSGLEAAWHGMAETEYPSPRALAAIRKIERKRGDLITLDD